jgi:myo-inositol-1(or 4)-monophosphatase
MPDTPQFIQVAKEAALSAGQFLMNNFGKINLKDIEEKSTNSFVTFVDKQAEKIIVDLIKQNFPDHSIIAEEGTGDQTKSDYVWFIDPLDGTTNYIQKLPHFSVSIAVQSNNKMIAGVVYNPVLKELFSAGAGQGAFLNNEPIKVDDNLDMNRTVLATGFPHRVKQYLPIYLPAFQDILLQCSGIRRWGSAALDLCYAACGRFSCYWELGVSPWDVAAGSVIVIEGGGLVTDFWGKDDYLENGFMIAGSRKIHQKLQEILSYHFKQHKSN